MTLIHFLAIVAIIVLITLAVPFMIYVSAKLAAFGFLRGKQLFEQQSLERKEGRNGNET